VPQLGWVLVVPQLPSISRSAITLNPPVVGNLGSITVTGTASVSLALRSFLLGFVTNAGTFLSDTQGSDVVLRNGISSAALRIGFGTGSTSSVVMNSTRATFNTPVTINQTANQLLLGNSTINASATNAQTYVIPDSGVSSTSLVLKDSSASQTINNISQLGFSTTSILNLQPVSATSTLTIQGNNPTGGTRLELNGSGTAATTLTFGHVNASGTFVSDSAVGDFVFRSGLTTGGMRFCFGSTSTAALFNSSGLRLPGSGALTVDRSTNQLQLYNTTINCSSPASRTLTIPDSGQNANLLTNSIICGLVNGATRPAILATAVPQPYEIRSYSSTSVSSDDAFLRLRAGGSTSSANASYIDLSGSSSVSDMNKNIVFGVGGTEVMRLDSNGLTLASGFSVNTSVVNTTVTVSGGGVSFSLPVTYIKSGSKVTLQFGSSGIRSFSSSASFLNVSIPAGLAPPTSGQQPMWIFPISVNGTFQSCTVFLNPTGTAHFEIYPNVSMATGWVSGNNVQWTGFVVEYFAL
jgi:hypothetical protein